MKFKELILKNRSCRGYDESFVVTRAQLEEMVDCARLSPSSQNYQPFKYYLSCTPEQNAIIQPLTGWARGLPEMKLPHDGHCPTGFIIVCYDKNIGPGAQRFTKDIGIVAQSILLAAAEMDINGCMIGNFSPERVSSALALAENLQPVLIIALGKKDENIVLCELSDGAYNYYRDEDDTHYVPKRTLAEELIN